MNYLSRQRPWGTHIQADQKLDDTPGVFIFSYKEDHSERYGKPDIAEVEQIEEIVFCEPEGHCDGLKNNQDNERI